MGHPFLGKRQSGMLGPYSFKKKPVGSGSPTLGMRHPVTDRLDPPREAFGKYRGRSGDQSRKPETYLPFTRFEGQVGCLPSGKRDGPEWHPVGAHVPREVHQDHRKKRLTSPQQSSGPQKPGSPRARAPIASFSAQGPIAPCRRPCSHGLRLRPLPLCQRLPSSPPSNAPDPRPRSLWHHTGWAAAP